MITTKKVRDWYTKYRKKYYADPGPHHKLPPAKDIDFTWLPEGSRYNGVTTFDEDGDPISIDFNSMLKDNGSLLKVVLLHEMSHIRLGPEVKCPSSAKKGRVPMKWRDEQVRLAVLGAPLL